MGYAARFKKEQTMSDNGKLHPFAAPAATPIVGQPFTFANATVPVTGQLTCNCRIPGAVMPVLASAPVTCPHCGKTYLAVLPLPPGAQVLVLQAAGPAAEQVPS